MPPPPPRTKKKRREKEEKRGEKKKERKKKERKKKKEGKRKRKKKNKPWKIQGNFIKLVNFTVLSFKNFPSKEFEEILFIAIQKSHENCEILHVFRYIFQKSICYQLLDIHLIKNIKFIYLKNTQI